METEIRMPTLLSDGALKTVVLLHDCLLVALGRRHIGCAA
jgi:hypothetical protein